ncbi:RHS repeat-associated core domain-containing protein [Pseudomonas sp. Sample_16]|uniref:RHS repeat-associated core domain-containing protein n=1 Tax=Pseudomonas sp. Sample_16 TaxID=2448263 RepID=UPI0010328798|nr:RHS repeat-associated core domain-containing protein [Pseudomonas sp. Sample_16]
MTLPREAVLCHYRYDPLDRLISHALPDTPERQRFYCKSRLVTEMQGAMRFSIVQHSDQLLAQQRGEGDAPDTTLLATDQQRSVLQTLKADHPPQPITYSLYGHRTLESGLLSLLGFNGERPDPVTGCYLLGNGYRAFNPVLMRFNSPDPLSPFKEGGLNCYSYCEGDPINHLDPTGRARWKLFSFFRNLFKKQMPTPSDSPTIRSTTDVDNSKRLSLERTYEKKLSTRRLSAPSPVSADDRYQYVGLHGSAKKYERSLTWGGVNPLFLGKGIDHIGPGFYVTPDHKLAWTYAFDTGGMLGEEQLYSVFAKNFIGMRAGTDYTATLHRPVFENEKPIQIVFREHIVSALRIRLFDPSRMDKLAFPRSSEAPF